MRNAEIGRLVGAALANGRPVGVVLARAGVGHDNEPRMTELPDTGCNLAPRCLSCPMPVCKYDMPVYGRRIHERRCAERTAELQRRLRAGARLDTLADAADMALALGVSTRTVYRLRGQVTS